VDGRRRQVGFARGATPNLLPEGRQQIRRSRKASNEPGGRRAESNPHVFASTCRPGRPIENVRKAWERAKRLAGLPRGLRIHDLRHSFASALANAGTPLYEIGTVLGHSQLSTTTRYAHHAPQRLIATASAAILAWDLLPAPAAVEADVAGE
jgi:integrase